MLDVVTRQKLSPLTFTKTMKQGKCLHFGSSTVPRSSCGTTMTCHDLFFNLPVRRRALQSAACVAEVRRKFEAIALACPHVSISLVDEHTGVKLIHVPGAARGTAWDVAMRRTFKHLFGADKMGGLKSVSHTCNGIAVSGLFSVVPSSAPLEVWRPCALTGSS